MPETDLTGSRIRDRRLALDIRQSDLARQVGISPAYLNLIEHNRRRIGGKLLLNIAARLGVDPRTLSEGAGTALVQGLQGAAARLPDAGAEAAAVGELARRFPGWARLVAMQHQRIETLEGLVAMLTDRLAHDPELARSMHEMLSVVTAIRSTAGILSAGEQIDAEWQARFQRNLYEDSRRLAQTAQALVEYLDASELAAAGGQGAASGLPQEALESWLALRDFHVGELEGAEACAPEDLLGPETPLGAVPATRAHALRYLRGYRADAQRLPIGRLSEALETAGALDDPVALAARLGGGVDLALVLRRIACLPPAAGRAPVGLVCCDGSGAITFRRPLEGFALPRFGPACALWPLFGALSRPLVPVRRRLEISGHPRRRFIAHAIAVPAPPASIDAPALIGATMLVVPLGEEAPARPSAAPGGAAASSSAAPAPGPQAPCREAPCRVGPGCRTCPQDACPARREPSVLHDAGAVAAGVF